MNTVCPCCGGQVETALPVVDLNTNTAAWRNSVIKLSGQKAEILHTLLEKYPSAVGQDAMTAALWGVHEPKTAYNLLSVLISKLREDLKPWGFSVDTTYGKGWRIDRVENITTKTLGRPQRWHAGKKPQRVIL